MTHPRRRRCVVPNVGGKTLRVARSQIARARRKVDRVTHQPSQRVKKGRVMSERPRAGTRLRVRGMANLVVTRGRM